MIGILKDWLFNQIGINCDLNSLEENNIFCDGIIIANILQKYGLLNECFVQRLIPTNKYEQCEHNLVLLRPLFEMLKVKYDYNVVRGVVTNVASVIISLLYELFVCLENKHHLYYVKKQHFNRIQANLIKNSNLESLSVNIVKPKNKTNDDVFCFEESIIRNKDIIEWYKQKYEIICNSLDNKLEHVRNKLCTEDETHSKPKKKKCCFSYSDVSMASLQLPEIDTFLKNNCDRDIVSYDDFIRTFKSKQYNNAMVTSLEKSIRDNLISKTWSEIMDKQNEIYNAIFSEIMLKQSQYEKQILTKLMQTQHQINIENENQIQATKNLMNEGDNKIKYDIDLKEDFEHLETVYKNEQKRVLELHRKLYKEKQEIIKRKLESECISIVNAIIDLAMYSSEYETEYNISVPKNLWRDWMQSFVKSEPIYIPFQKLKRDISMGYEINYDDVIDFESKESKVLTENDLDEYLYTCGRWFYEDICIEHEYINENILAFIVYRLLSLKYPPPPSPLPADIPLFETSAVLLNFHGTDCIEKLRALLTKPGVHVFDTDSVIKVCIDAFKRETKSPTEEIKKGKRKQSKSKKSASPDLKTNAKDKRKSKNTGKTKIKKSKSPVAEDIIISDGDKMINLVDKDTQTSIPKDEDIEPQKTPIGIIGEKINTILKNGEELDNSTLVSAIIEYLKLLEGLNGWIILNYPSTLKQAAELELALTGKYIPAEELGIEDVDITRTIPVDDFSETRKSKLLPSPAIDSDNCFKTYFSVFIKAKGETNDAYRTKPNDSTEVQEEYGDEIDSSSSINSAGLNKNVDSLEQFYTNQIIFTEFPFNTFDLITLKKLARTIINRNNMSIIDSIELFGEESINKITKSKKGRKSSPSLSKKNNKLGKGKKKGRQSKSNVSSIRNAEIVGIEVKNDNEGTVTNAEPDNLPVDPIVMQPDDENWRNISIPIDGEVASMLATMWENIETSYIQNLHDIFNENRILHAGLVPYTAYARDNVYKVINNADLKQNLVDVFICDYNSINDDLRVLTDMKSYLHCKVLEMQNNLWKISDARRECSEARRQEIIHENWLLFEICMLINNFLSLIHTEFIRSEETMKLINDYYLLMLNRDPPSTANPLVHSVRRLTVDDLLVQLSDLKRNSRSSSDTLDSKTRENLISRILVDCKPDDKCLEYISSFLHHEIEVSSTAMQSKAQYFYNVIKIERDFGSSKKENTSKSKKSDKPKTSLKHVGRKSKSGPVTTSGNKPNVVPNSSDDTTDLLLREWSFSIDVELKRINFRMELIKKRSGEDIMEYFCLIEDVFCALHGYILERYDKEISSINTLCDFIRTAIEEETPIHQPIVLDQFSFYIDNSISRGVQHVDGEVSELIEESDGCRFTINQLNKLKNIFKIAGPYGVIRKQPLCYIIQDLMLFNAADNEPHLPILWNSLNESQLQNVIDSIFGPEYAIDWRDFIIYNLDIPYPSINQILSLRKQFLLNDHENTEVITSECFENTVLWFEEELPPSPQRALRIVLIKRLLFELFQVGTNSVNYTALLLYFCKECDPVDGFKKALVLSVGKNVITSEDELRCILKEEADIRESVTKLLNDLVGSVVDNKEGVLIYEIFPNDLDTYIKEPSGMETSYSVSSSASLSKSHSDDTGKDSVSFIAGQEQDCFMLSYKTNTIEDLEKSWVSRVPVDTVISVLNACFLHQDKTFNIRNLYLNCLEEEADEDGMIEGYELVNLGCILKIFTITNKFKISSPCNILKEVIQ